eukprot:CAMPEP_0195104894 /NCGR_PEP_ID=MMETSP0448-20130528/74145_1 /TAXON_ID=66468 /ORGANISM="Heterocapsa triquestra, Strain CCMP 448" /LENGTH=84 /DNA_ID=CAMNT_0040140819 /DNA_START=42 /DNA_END=292 /DNA_ORIENTATION=+
MTPSMWNMVCCEGSLQPLIAEEAAEAFHKCKRYPQLAELCDDWTMQELCEKLRTQPPPDLSFDRVRELVDTVGTTDHQAAARAA